MKKKFMCILLGLFLSVGIGYPTCAYDLSCTTITSVCPDYFWADYGNSFSGIVSGFLDFFDFFAELEVVCCPEEPINTDEPV